MPPITYCSILPIPFHLDWFQPFQCPQTKFASEKPTGGLWSSPFTPSEDVVSNWHQFCLSTRIRKGKAYLHTFQLYPDAKVCQLETLPDMMDFLNTYLLGGAATLTQPYPFFNFINVPFDAYLDWDAISRDFDALYLDGAFHRISPFYGWDVDTLLLWNLDALNLESLQTQAFDYQTGVDASVTL